MKLKVRRDKRYYCEDCETSLTREDAQKHLDEGHVIRVLSITVTEVKT